MPSSAMVIHPPPLRRAASRIKSAADPYIAAIRGRIVISDIGREPSRYSATKGAKSHSETTGTNRRSMSHSPLRSRNNLILDNLQQDSLMILRLDARRVRQASRSPQVRLPRRRRDEIHAFHAKSF